LGVASRPRSCNTQNDSTIQDHMHKYVDKKNTILFKPTVPVQSINPEPSIPCTNNP